MNNELNVKRTDLTIDPLETIENVNGLMNAIFTIEFNSDIDVNDIQVDTKRDILNDDDVHEIKRGTLKSNISLEELEPYGLDVNNYTEDDFDDSLNDYVVDAFSDGALQIKRFNMDDTLYQYLLDWYGRGEIGVNNAIKLMKSKIRGYYEHDVSFSNYIYYVTGVGYDTISSDLLGFDCDGKARDYFLNKFVYGERNADFEQKRLSMVKTFEKNLNKQ